MWVNPVFMDCVTNAVTTPFEGHVLVVIIIIFIEKLTKASCHSTNI